MWNLEALIKVNAFSRGKELLGSKENVDRHTMRRPALHSDTEIPRRYDKKGVR